MKRDTHRSGAGARSPAGPDVPGNGPSPERRRRRHRIGPWRRATAGARLLPSFLVIGAQKSATTALFDLLAAHPLVLPPLRRAVHYLDDFHDFGPHWYRSC